MKEIAKFLTIFIFLTLVALIIINWGTVKGIFNYQAIYQDIYRSLKEKKEMVSRVPSIELSSEFTEKPDSLEIPKIETSAPLIFAESADEKDLEKALKKGVVHYPQSVLPGQEGQIIILGHSAPSGWPKKDYDWIFSRLNELNLGDEIFLNFEHQQYYYLVSQKSILEVGQELPQLLTNAESMLVLLSCWPPGVSERRIAISAELAGK